MDISVLFCYIFIPVGCDYSNLKDAMNFKGFFLNNSMGFSELLVTF